MSSKILGNKSLVEKARKATPQDKNIYINWEALQELPDQYEAVVTAVKFDPKDLKKYFNDVGNGTWMPKTEIMYQIAEAKGISGGDNSIAESVYEEVDINPMLCKGMEEAATYRRIKVGAKVVKFSTVMEEDGTTRRSSPCTQIYNVWDRCNEAWSKEEKYSEGYTKQSKYPPKYKTKWDRKQHLDSEMKFAMAKAETKAHAKTIRELAGLMTGYSVQDLSSGELLFAKIRKSSEALRLEQAAHLSHITGGGSNQSVDLLFGETEHKNVTEEKETIIEDNIPETTPVEEAIAEMECFLISPYSADQDFKTRVEQALNWLKNTPNADQTEYWSPILTDLETIRSLMG